MRDPKGSFRALATLSMPACAVLGLCLCSAQAWGLSDAAGTAGAQFLKMGAGGRAGAMAEAQLALAGDVNAAYYNPAGLTRAVRPMFTGMHDEHFQGIRYDYLAYSYPIGRLEDASRHALAASVYNLSAEDIERRVEDTDIPVGDFGVSDTAFALSYAYRPVPRLGVGATVKYVRSKLDAVGAYAVAADLGAQYRLWQQPKLDLGVVVRNAGTRMKFEQGSDPLPLTLGIGAAAQPFRGLSLALDFLKASDTDAFYACGAEYEARLGEHWAASLRGGYSTHFKDAGDIKGWTAGFGLTLRRVSIDFAWIPFGDLGNTFKYSLLVRF